MHRVPCGLICVAALVTSLGTAGGRVAAKNWNDGNSTWSTGAFWTPAGVPTLGEAVNIVFADGNPRTVTYNVSAPSLGLLTIDLTGAGVAANTLSITANNSLAANGIWVGGFSGITSLTTAGRGAIEQFAGTVSTNPGRDLVLGHGSGSTGTYTLGGGALVANQSEYVGLSGNGVFNHSAGSNTINASGVGTFIVGVNASSTGAYNLSGTGSLVSNSTEYVGYSGTGVFNQTGGTHSINGGNSLFVGHSEGGVGAYTLSAGSLSVSGVEYVGYNGVGSETVPSIFNHSGGTNIAGGGLVLGANAGAVGQYNLSGTGSLTSNGHEYIGNSGLGAFDQTGGAHTVGSVPANRDLYVGYSANQIGFYSLDGSASSLTVNGNEYLGESGLGVFTQSGGTHTVGVNLVLGSLSGSTGSYELGGSGSSLTVHGDEYIGAGGPGDFTQSDGTHTVGSVATNRQLFVGHDAGGGTYNLLDGTLAVNGNETLGHFAAGSFTQSGGTHDVSADLTFGGTPTGNGSYLLSGGDLNVGGTEKISALSSIGSTFTQTGGTHTIGSPTAFLGLLDMAENINSVANYSLSGGSLTVYGFELVGDGGTATFTHTGGTNTILPSGGAPIGVLTVGFISVQGGSGTYTLSGNGVLAVTGDTYVGGGDMIGNGTGVMNLNGGTATVTGLFKVWDYDGTVVNLAGATLSVGSLNTDGDPSRFTWTSGALNLTNSSLTIGSSGPLGTALTINSSKLLTVSGTTTIDPLRAVTISGGSFSTGDLVNNGAFNFVSGTLGITGAGGLTVGTGGALGATATLGAGQRLNVANSLGVNASGLLVVESGATVTAGGGIVNDGEIHLAGSTAQLAGGALANSGLILGDGRIANGLTNVAGGEIRAENAKRLKLQGANGTNAGRINLQGGTAEFSQALTNGAAGRIEGRGTLITGGAGLTNNGHIALASGITDVFGDVTNDTGAGSLGVSVSGNADVTFWDDVTNVAGSLFRVSSGSSATFFGTFAGAGISGTGDVYFEADVTPGASPTIAQFGGNVALGSTSTLAIELGGAIRGSEYDAIVASGDLTLSGALAVSLIDAGAGLFAPEVGDSFDILDWGGLSGTFASIYLPTLAGLEWDTSMLYTDGVLSVASPFLEADFNENGAVNAVDFALWKTGFGASVDATHMQGDANGDEDVDGADFLVWQRQLGNVPAVAATAVIPEPGSFLLCIVAAAGFCRLRGPKASRTHQ